MYEFFATTLVCKKKKKRKKSSQEAVYIYIYRWVQYTTCGEYNEGVKPKIDLISHNQWYEVQVYLACFAQSQEHG